MNKIIRAIGSLIVAALIVSIPVLFGCSLALPWILYIKLLLGIGTIGEFAVTSIWMYYETEEE